MVLQRSEVEIPLSVTMATKPSIDVQGPSSMRLVQNLHWRELGLFEKCPGTDVSLTLSAPTGSEYSESTSDVPYGLITRGDAVSVVTKHHGLATNTSTSGSLKYAYGAYTNSAASLQYCPVNYDVSRRFVERAQFSKASGGIVRTTCANYNGVQVIAWIVQSSTCYLYYKAIDAMTGAVVTATQRTAMATTSGWQLSSCEYTESGKEGVLIAYTDQSATPVTVKTIRWDSATKAFATDSNLTTNSAGRRFGLRKQSAQNKIYFVFKDNTSGFVTAQSRTISTVSSTHTANHAGDYFDVVEGTSSTLVLSATTSTAYAEVFGTPANVITLMTASSETFKSITGARELQSATTNDAVVYVTTAMTSPTTCWRTRVLEVNFDAATPSSGSTSQIGNGYVVGLAQYASGHAHVPVAIDPTTTESAYEYTTSVLLFRYRGNYTNGATRNDPVARICHDRFYLGVDELDAGVLGGSYVDSNDNLWFGLTADRSPISELSLSRYYPQTVFVSRVATGSPIPMPYAQSDNGVVMSAGGVCWEWDGDIPAIASPVNPPRLDISVSSGTGTTTTSGISYIAIYRWIDAAGRLHRSAPSNSVSTGVIANKEVIVYVSWPTASAYDGSVAELIDIELYATADGGSVYYLAGTSSDGSGDKDVYDSSSAGNGCFFQFSGCHPGKDGRPQLYSTGTDGSEIVPEPTPAFTSIARIVDRMWAVDAEDRTRIWFSKPMVNGYAVEWSTFCTLYVGDECMAVADVGGIPTVFARGGIYQIFGDGPDANGNGVFAPARKLPHEVDCLDPASVCRTPIGVVFRGRRGFYSLGGDLAVQPFLLLDPELTNDPEIDPGLSSVVRYRVVYHEQTNEIQICAGASRYVYNVVEQKWSKTALSGVSTYDLAVCRGQLWRMDKQSATVAKLQSENLYTQLGSLYNSSTESWSVQTPWINIDGISGYGRLWELVLTLRGSASISNVSTLTVSLETRSSTTENGTDTFTWTGTQLSDLGGSNDSIALRMKPAHQQAKAIRVTITEACTSAYSGSVPLALRLVLGVDGKAIRKVKTNALKGAS